VMEETQTGYAPEVVWVESCPFSKDEGKKTGEECISPGGTRTIHRGIQQTTIGRDRQVATPLPGTPGIIQRHHLLIGSVNFLR
ncbi:hypothetical protein, partial [Klebsiella pneumoniae]|uniref:hypothetical protein n=1 Tax=Klebsiella pneumoniae TaxID=573 RepID=UPI001F1A765F